MLTSICRLENLVLAVPSAYKYLSVGKPVVSCDYENTIAVAAALFSHTRVKIPYGLTVVGY